MPHGYGLMVKGKNEETQGHQVSHDDSAECFSGTLSHKFGFSCSKGFSAYQSRRSASVVRLHPEKTQCPHVGTRPVSNCWCLARKAEKHDGNESKAKQLQSHVNPCCYGHLAKQWCVLQTLSMSSVLFRASCDFPQQYHRIGNAAITPLLLVSSDLPPSVWSCHWVHGKNLSWGKD